MAGSAASLPDAASPGPSAATALGRVERIRARLLERQAPSPAETPRALAQWYNWPNWGNWGNWGGSYLRRTARWRWPGR